MGNASASVASQIDKLSLAFEKLKSSGFYDKLEELAATHEGPIITPDVEEFYTPARCRAFNQDMRGYPLVIAQPKCVTDVVKCVNFVRDHGRGIDLCVCSGGHSNRCMMDDSFVIDLKSLNSVSINDADPKNIMVTVGGGALLEEADRALAPYNLAIVAGSYPQVGIGGWTLAGGFGWLSRIHGLGVDNLVEVEVVLATGKVVIANGKNDHKSLIVGCRGAGGNFGVVTKFTFRVHRLPHRCYAGAKVFLAPTFVSALEIYKNVDALVSEVPNHCSCAVVFPVGASVVPTLWACFTDESDMKSIPFLAKGSTLGGWLTIQDSVKPVSYHFGLQTLTSKSIRSGHIFSTVVQVGTFGERLPDDFFVELLTYTRLPRPSTLEDAVVILFPMGGAIQKENDGMETMISPTVRKLKYFAVVEARWKASAADAGRCDARNWCTEASRILSKFSPALMRHAVDCINERNIREHEINAQDIGFHESTLRRLREIKAAYDPRNLFSMNPGIPAASDST